MPLAESLRLDSHIRSGLFCFMRVAMSYALFGNPDSFEFPFYFRGTYLNARMNEVLFPEFETVIQVESDIYNGFEKFWIDLTSLNKNIHIVDAGKNEQRCRSMLWRLNPLFSSTVWDFVICRDLDSVSTYREACCVYEWLAGGLWHHAINDNAAHGGLMGGLISFWSDGFKRDTGIMSMKNLVGKVDLKQHGSDQNLLNKVIHPKIKNNLLFHVLKGAGAEAREIKKDVGPRKEVDHKLWITDLISRYVGSAGVIDFELLRFLRSRPEQKKFDEFEKKHKNICYWRQ